LSSLEIEFIVEDIPYLLFVKKHYFATKAYL